MVARGDFGVEVPIEEIAYTQKQLIAKTNLAGKACYYCDSDARIDGVEPSADAGRGN